MAEIPGANGYSNARSLARLFGAISAGGSEAPVGLLSAKTLACATATRIAGIDLVLKKPVTLGAGFFLNDEGEFGPGSASFGHSGWGGSYAFFDPDANLGVSYAMNRMVPNTMPDTRGMRLLNALYSCL